MEHLDDISVGDLQRALDEVEGKKPTQRLTAAIAYKNGVTQTELAEWYGVERRTIYNWLSRLDREPLERAVRDEPRTGRPRKLTAEQRKTLERVLSNPPSDEGYDGSTWSPETVRDLLEETFGVEYSLPSCRRLMKEAGLRYERPARQSVRTTPGESDEGRDGSGDRSGRWVPR